MDKDVFEFSQKIRKLQNNIKRYQKKCAELQEQLPIAQELEQKLAPLQHSDDARERGKYVQAFTQRCLIQAALTTAQAELTIAKYELEKISNIREELSQSQPE